MHARRIGRARGVHGGDDGERDVRDLDDLGGVNRDIGVGRRERRDRLADEARMLGREGGPVGREEAVALQTGREGRDHRRERAPVEDGDHAGTLPRRARLHRGHARVSVGAPHEGDVQASLGTDVVEVRAATGEEARILHSLDDGARVAHRRSGRQRLATRGSTSPASSSSCSTPQLSGFSTIDSQPPRVSTFFRIFSATSSASPRR